MNVASINEPASEVVRLAARTAGVELRCQGPAPGEADALKLTVDKQGESERSGLLPWDGYRIECASGGTAQIRASSQRGLAYALLDLAEDRIDLTSPAQYTPTLAVRSYHMWLPFALGQAYGGEGYSAWESRTDWWWYDREYWVGFLADLASARFNMIALWHTHPHPALIDYEEFPEAAFFDPQRQRENVEQFRWILKTAKSYGIDIVIMQYNIHVSPGLAKAHGLGAVKATAGYGGEDTQLVRKYNRYCLEKLFSTYPDLSGLMIGGELNKDAFDFLDTTILPPLLEASSRPTLHFRLWGQHFPDEVRKLADKISDRFVMWHKISKEMISVPQADVRLSRWCEQVEGIPICALTGSGNAPAFRHQGRIYVDPDFVAEQLGDLKNKGGSGMGLFCGVDNWFFDKDGLLGKEETIGKWMSANWLTRQISGRMAWRNEQCPREFWVDMLARHYGIGEQEAGGAFRAAVSSSRVLPGINFVVGQYGQDLGFLGTLGKFSQQTSADPPGAYRLGGPYAWPLHDWGVKQVDIMQAAGSSEQTAGLLDMAQRLDRDCSAGSDEIGQLDEPAGMSDFVSYVKLNCLLGPVHAQLFQGAVNAYRIPFCQDVQEALEHLQAVIEHLDNAAGAAEEASRFARELPIIPIKIREDLPTPLRWGGDRLAEIVRQRDAYADTLQHMQSHKQLFEAAKLYWQSHCRYHDVFRWLRRDGNHITDENVLNAKEVLADAISWAGRCVEMVRATSGLRGASSQWLDFLEFELERLDPLAMKVGRYTGHIESHGSQDVVSHWNSMESPCFFDGTLLSFFETDAADFSLRRSDVAREFRLAYDDEALWLSIECSSDNVPATLMAFVCNKGPETVQQLDMDLRRGKMKSTLAHLRAPHGMAFDEPMEYDMEVEPGPASQGGESFVIRIPFEVVGKAAEAGDRWGFNLLWEKRGLLWSSVCGEFNWLDPQQNGTICFED